MAKEAKGGAVMLYVDLEEALQKIDDAQKTIAEGWEHEPFIYDVFVYGINNLKKVLQSIAKDPDKTIIQFANSYVRCKDCACKKAVPIGRVMVWRCPYSTVDVELDGYCHRGVKMSEDRAN